MNSSMHSLMHELIQTGLSSLFDPNPVSFRPEHEKGVRPVQRLLRQPSNYVYQLHPNLSRNAFLCGCLDYSEHQKIEHLIVGYGVKRGNATIIHALEHVIGEVSKVNIPPSTMRNVQNHSRSLPRSEVIIFHNHPPNWFNASLDNIPLASTADRNTLLAKKYLEPFECFRWLSGVGGVRFYLGENGFVREIVTPNLFQLLEMFTTRNVEQQ